MRYVFLAKLVNDGWVDKVLTIRMGLSLTNEICYLQCEGYGYNSLLFALSLLSNGPILREKDVLEYLESLYSTGELLDVSEGSQQELKASL